MHLICHALFRRWIHLHGPRQCEPSQTKTDAKAKNPSSACHVKIAKGITHESHRHLADIFSFYRRRSFARNIT